MDITITKLTQPWLIDRACEITSGKTSCSIDRRTMYVSEHSPMYTQWFWIELAGIPSASAMHLRTHEKNGCTFFVQSNRGKAADRDTPVNVAIMANAKHLVDMSHKRLCKKASTETRDIMLRIGEVMWDVDQALAEQFKPNCAYLKVCPEPKPCREVIR